MIDEEKKEVARLCFHLDLDTTNEAHVKLHQFLHRVLPGNGKHVALQMLLSAMPTTADEESALILQAVRNKPMQNKRGPKRGVASGKKRITEVAGIPLKKEVEQPPVIYMVETVDAVKEVEVKVVVVDVVNHSDDISGLLGRNFGKY